MNKQFEQQVLQHIVTESLIDKGDRILVACSGGVDSMSLLHFLYTFRNQLQIEIAAAHVDHMLRGQQSAEDGQLVEAYCKANEIPFFGCSIPIPEIYSKQGGNVQAICRVGRYAYFSDILLQEGYNKLATAHHADDQLETIIMQIAKGQAPLGMPKQRNVPNGALIRPLLAVQKRTIATYVQAEEIAYREDPSNASDKYLRNRIRQQIVPLLVAENNRAALNAVQLAGKLRENEDCLQALAEQWIEENLTYSVNGLPIIPFSQFLTMHVALQRRVFLLLLNYIYKERNPSVDYSSSLVEQLVQHASSTAGHITIDLPDGYQFRREYDQLLFVKSEARSVHLEEKALPKGTIVDWNETIQLYWTDAHAVNEELMREADEVMYFHLEDNSLPLYVRQRKDGDRIQLPGMLHPKKVSRILIDDKIPMSKRNMLPVVTTRQGHICALPGVRYGEAFSKNSTQYPYVFLYINKNKERNKVKNDF